jgi:MFS family permease
MHPQPTTDRRSPRYRYVVVGSLWLVYTLNFVDRQILAILAEPIGRDLNLSDTQLGMLTGLMFALFYTLFGIPVAMLADRKNRIRLIAASCALWSFFTILSGGARSFGELALARIGVGIGEAGCSPPSYSILSDYFPPEQRGRAFAIYALGVPFGSFLGTFVGTRIYAEYGWRSAFLVAGLAGLVLAPILLAVVREPERGRFDPQPNAAPPGGLTEMLGFFLRSPVFTITGLCCGLAAFCGYSLLSWTPTYLVRVHGMTLSQVGTLFALASAGSIVLAAWLGAWIADHAGRRNPVNFAMLPGGSIVLAIPFILACPLAPDGLSAMLLLFPAMVLTAVYFVPALVLLQNRTPSRLRATVSAVLLFMVNLIGLGCGPLFVGMISDYLAPAHGDRSLGIALQSLSLVAVLAGAGYALAARFIRQERIEA